MDALTLKEGITMSLSPLDLDLFARLSEESTCACSSGKKNYERRLNGFSSNQVLGQLEKW